MACCCLFDGPVWHNTKEIKLFLNNSNLFLSIQANVLHNSFSIRHQRVPLILFRADNRNLNEKTSLNLSKLTKFLYHDRFIIIKCGLAYSNDQAVNQSIRLLLQHRSQRCNVLQPIFFDQEPIGFWNHVFNNNGRSWGKNDQSWEKRKKTDEIR